jgi:hypothetical protein
LLQSIANPPKQTGGGESIRHWRRDHLSDRHTARQRSWRAVTRIDRRPAEPSHR